MKEVQNGCLVYIKVKTSQPKFSAQLNSRTNELNISLTKPAVDGKANLELVSILRKAFGYCEIKIGMSQSRKMVLVSANVNQIQSWINQL